MLVDNPPEYEDFSAPGTFSDILEWCIGNSNPSPSSHDICVFMCNARKILWHLLSENKMNEGVWEDIGDVCP